LKLLYMTFASLRLLVPKLHLGTFLVPREVSLRADRSSEAARTSAFPSTTWERGKGAIALLAFLVLSGSYLTARAADAPALQPITFHGQSYVVHTVDPQKEDLQLFLNDDQNKPLHDFVALDKYVTGKGEHLLFAANAGMFEATFQPCGLLVEDEKEISPLNLNDAPGNFYMKPNGVFLINEKHEARIIESSEYTTLLTPAICATQSGPMLVHGGNILISTLTPRA